MTMKAVDKASARVAVGATAQRITRLISTSRLVLGSMTWAPFTSKPVPLRASSFSQKGSGDPAVTRHPCPSGMDPTPNKVLVPGDVITLDWIPGTGMVVTAKGKVQGEPFKEPEFYKAIMSIWFGPVPGDFKLKEALLGQK